MKKLSLDELNRLSPEEYKLAEKWPVVVVLDNIRSALNVGSIFRTCDAFSVSHLYLCGITARPPHKEINKTAIGAAETVDWSYHENILDAVRALKNDGYQVIGVEQTTDSIDLQSFQAGPGEKKLALVFGNEVQGLSDEILKLLDGALEIPQFGTKHSINVAVCAGMVIWEVFRQQKFN